MSSSEQHRARSQLRRAALVCFFFMIVEVAGGTIAHSLAIFTDAAHLLSDLSSFAISLFCLRLAEKTSNPWMSFGFKRAEVIGALLSVGLIWTLTALLIIEAVSRTIQIVNHDPTFTPADGQMMSVVALFGIFANLAILYVLGNSHHHGHSHGLEEHVHSHGAYDDHGHSHGHELEEHVHSHGAHDDHGGHSHSHGHEESPGHGHHDQRRVSVAGESVSSGDESDFLNGLRIENTDNINVTAAYVHAAGDLIQSCSVLLAGIIIYMFPAQNYPLAQLADPLATLLFSILVTLSTVELVRTSLHILMQGVPKGFDPNRIKAAIMNVPGVLSVHDLHLWSLSVNDHFLSVHVLVKDRPDQALLESIKSTLISRNVHHSSIQLEVNSETCAETQCHSYGSLEEFAR